MVLVSWEQELQKDLCVKRKETMLRKKFVKKKRKEEQEEAEREFLSFGAA